MAIFEHDYERMLFVGCGRHCGCGDCECSESKKDRSGSHVANSLLGRWNWIQCCPHKDTQTTEELFWIRYPLKMRWLATVGTSRCRSLMVRDNAEMLLRKACHPEVSFGRRISRDDCEIHAPSRLFSQELS